MVVSRSGVLTSSGQCKEVVRSAIVPPSGTRSVTRRINELPSLRYGHMGASNNSGGPLRITEHYHCSTLPSSFSRKTRLVQVFPTTDGAFKATRALSSVSNNHPEILRRISKSSVIRGGGSSNEKSSGKQHQFSCVLLQPLKTHTRRVRFDLPPPDGPQEAEDDDKPVAAADSWRAVPPHGIPVATVSVSASPSSVRTRVHPTGRYIRGTLSPTAHTATPTAAAPPRGHALLKAARDSEDALLKDLLRRALLVGISENEVNAVDSSGRTALSYIASNGTVDLLESILKIDTVDPNKPDNEGNTPLHFAAQAGQVECLNYLLSRCPGIEIDARNNLGFTPLMKAALQGRNKCAKLLLFAGANPTLRDSGRGLRAEQWARFCGRYVCADVIEKHARQRLLERSTSYGNWGSENEIGTRVLMGKVVPVPQMPQQSNGLKSKLRKVFRTSSGSGHTQENSISSARLVSQLTSAALCASTPVLPSGPTVPPMVKSLIRPLTVPRLQITLVNNNNNNNNNNNSAEPPYNKTSSMQENDRDIIQTTTTTPITKPVRMKKKK